MHFLPTSLNHTLDPKILSKSHTSLDIHHYRPIQYHYTCLFFEFCYIFVCADISRATTKHIQVNVRLYSVSECHVLGYYWNRRVSGHFSNYVIMTGVFGTFPNSSAENRNVFNLASAPGPTHLLWWVGPGDYTFYN